MLTKCTDRFVETEIDEECVIMGMKTGDFLSLSGTGRAVWQLIDGSRDFAAIVARLAIDYDGDEATIAGDVAALVAELREAGLVHDG